MSVSWSIVSTVKESKLVTLRFVAYHLAVGADHVYLYLDDENDPSYAHLHEHPNVSVYLCDENHWQNIIGKERPIEHQFRQSHNANHAYRQLKSDWLMLLDADEFLVSKEGTIAEQLDDSLMMIRAGSMEPSYVSGLDKNMLFFDPLEKGLKRHVAEYLGPYMRDSIFVEHDIGKSFVQKGIEKLRFRIHRAEFPNFRESFARSHNLRILHFLNFGAKNWALKYERRILSGRLNPFGTRSLDINENHPKVRFHTGIGKSYERDGLRGVEDYFLSFKKPSAKALNVIAERTDHFEFDFDFGKALFEQLGYGDGSPQQAVDIFDWDGGTSD